jgi:indole-3-glycerol phosphate synthase
MSILVRILERKRAEVEALRELGGAELARRAAAAPPVRDFARALRAGPAPRVIAEFKRASPSRGPIRAGAEPAAIARAYAAAGACALSVLTDREFFQGELADLGAARAACELPVLRKDFTLDALQLYEARAAGADAVLLIVAALDQRALESLQARAWQLGLATLVEVHDREELSRAIGSGARAIGVNNRNLRTLKVDIAASDGLAAQMPDGVVAVSESGLQSRADLERLAAAGYGAFLIGERFMTDPDPAAAIRLLIGAAPAAPPHSRPHEVRARDTASSEAEHESSVKAEPH